MAGSLINVIRAFTLTLVREGQVVVERIEAGVQRVEQDIADHWYTKAHTAEVPAGLGDEAADAVAAQDAENAQAAAEAQAQAEVDVQTRAAKNSSKK